MKTFLPKLGLALFALSFLSSCSKETVEPAGMEQKQVFIRIKQVEKNGTISYSPKVRVQVKTLN